MSSQNTSTKRDRSTFEANVAVVIGPDDVIPTVKLADLSEEDQAFAKQIVAEKYFSTYRQARREADESDGVTDIDTWGAQLEACEIDTEQLPPGKKQRAIQVFGEGRSVLDAPDLVLNMHFSNGKSHRVECREPTDVPHPDPRFAGYQQYKKTFFTKPGWVDEKKNDCNADIIKRGGEYIRVMMDGMPTYVTEKAWREIRAS